MRSRLALAFALFAFLLLAAFVGIRAISLHDLIEDQAATHLHHDATTMAQVLASGGQPPSRSTVEDLLPADQQARVQVDGGEGITVTGADYAHSDDPLLARALSGPVEVELRERPARVGSVFRDSLGTVLALALLLLVAAGVAAHLVAGRMVAPFRKLAAAADALSRGRTDLDLPRSRVPEIRAVADALGTTAEKSRRTVKRDHEFLEDASHRLRTPVTGLRLELEELGLRRDLDPEVRDTVERGVATLDHLDELTTGIFAMARAGRGASEERQLALDELARQTAQSWALELADKRMELSSSVDGDLTLPVTPGPVEQVLELVLADLLRSARGRVTLAFHGNAERVTLQVAAEPQPDLGARGPGPELVQQMVDTLAGRCSGDVLEGGLRVWLPRL